MLTLEAKIRLHRPDAHLEAEGAHVSLWWKDVPHVEGERVGCLGHYQAESSGAAVLQLALAKLREAGCTLAIGPMDGNTWRSYRFVTDPGTEPPFFLEPANPPDYPRHWVEAGFAPLAHYSSSRVQLAEYRDLGAIEWRLADRKVRIRSLDPARFHEELERIYEVSRIGFADNFLYTPIGKEEFIAMYSQVEPLIIPELVLIAESEEGEPAGFMFTIPDALEAPRTGSRPTTVLIKSLAVHPRWRNLGMGSVLIQRSQEAARKIGFTSAIHALQHEANQSLKITKRNEGVRIREYTLYSRSLRA